ncbi:nuclear transport factor 2 family protein [Maribacter antarcticus]|uniref:nuclear transport factor 2 family protein n=1 Tax=Maribacter antarcticus TaxID=505250 RepID=UPI00047B58BD|nr:nuclear transport factor 2 family protein [Maribacter antarcticus]
MKYFPFWVGLFIFSLQAVSQQSTEIYLIDVTKNADTIRLSAPLNISNNEGYDNQPSFFDNETILFSSTRNNQTDIALYDIAKGTTTWISNTTQGSEYSPLKIPKKEAVSAIRLDSNGLQRLYQYDVQTGISKELLKDLKVGYHVWYNDHIIVCTVLVENRMDLVVANLQEGTTNTVQKNVGRSLHTIPGTNLISYISKQNKTLEIKSLNPVSGATKTINYIWNGREDMAWLSQNTIISSTDRIIAQVKADTTGIWDLFHQFGPLELHNMTRIAVSPDQKKLALVAEPAPAKIVQKQVESYNERDLDAFVNCYSEAVVVRNFPADTLYVGHEKMRKKYSNLSPDKKGYTVEVVKRITIGNKVIDQERVTGNGKIKMQVALYEVINGTISSMTFIFKDTNVSNPETIVQQQLDAYNARDIDGFLKTYSEDIGVYNFPEDIRTQGQKDMRKGYGNYFKNTPDLHADIKNRIVIGNIVIDEEFVTANGNTFSAVAIYEVENEKISNVTFVR